MNTSAAPGADAALGADAFRGSTYDHIALGSLAATLDLRTTMALPTAARRLLLVRMLLVFQHCKILQAARCQSTGAHAFGVSTV